MCVYECTLGDQIYISRFTRSPEALNNIIFNRTHFIYINVERIFFCLTPRAPVIVHGPVQTQAHIYIHTRTFVVIQLKMHVSDLFTKTDVIILRRVPARVLHTVHVIL